jgi:hypothetical protein
MALALPRWGALRSHAPSKLHESLSTHPVRGLTFANGESKSHFQVSAQLRVRTPLPTFNNFDSFSKLHSRRCRCSLAPALGSPPLKSFKPSFQETALRAFGSAAGIDWDRCIVVFLDKAVFVAVCSLFGEINFVVRRSREIRRKMLNYRVVSRMEAAKTLKNEILPCYFACYQGFQLRRPI